MGTTYQIKICPECGWVIGRKNCEHRRSPQEFNNIHSCKNCCADLVLKQIGFSGDLNKLHRGESTMKRYSREELAKIAEEMIRGLAKHGLNIVQARKVLEYADEIIGLVIVDLIEVKVTYKC